jgi:RNA polymerase sigma factor (sigma-70 family)
VFDDINSAEFLAALQKRSPDTFKILADRLLSPLCRFLAFGKNVPEADAEEMASDVLMTVYDKIGTFQHGGRAKLTTWIFQIAKNRAIDYHRASRPENVELTNRIYQTGPGSDAAYAGRNRSLLEWLLRELEGFSEQDQWLLKWRALEIPYSEIAGWLGINEGTARVRHKRAIEKLLQKAAEPSGRKGAGQL